MPPSTRYGRGKNVKLVVSVRAEGLTTEEAGKKRDYSFQLSDSFRNAGAAKVKRSPSKRDENLEFTVYHPKGRLLQEEAMNCASELIIRNRASLRRQ